MNILIVEDDKKIVNFVQTGLNKEHYIIDIASSGTVALEKATSNKYSLIILDVRIPEINGVEVCRRIRKAKINTPILMLSALNDIEDRVRGLDAGADDYLTKPFSFTELTARIRALLRREKTVKATKLKVGNLVLNPANHEVRRGNKEIILSKREYSLLLFLLKRVNRICTRAMISEQVWGINCEMQKNSNIIDVYMSYLRNKIEKGFRKKIIHTVRDIGYRINDKNLDK